VPTLDRLMHDAEHAEKDVSWLARAIVAKRATVTAAITLLVTLGVIPQTVGGTLEHWLEIGVSVAGFIGGVVWTQAATTPSSPALQPKSSNDLALVEDVPPGADTAADLAAINTALDSAASAVPAPAATE
jgi:hypothetical protein